MNMAHKKDTKLTKKLKREEKRKQNRLEFEQRTVRRKFLRENFEPSQEKGFDDNLSSKELKTKCDEDELELQAKLVEREKEKQLRVENLEKRRNESKKNIEQKRHDLKQMKDEQIEVENHSKKKSKKKKIQESISNDLTNNANIKIYDSKLSHSSESENSSVNKTCDESNAKEQTSENDVCQTNVNSKEEEEIGGENNHKHDEHDLTISTTLKSLNLYRTKGPLKTRKPSRRSMITRLEEKEKQTLEKRESFAKLLMAPVDCDDINDSDDINDTQSNQTKPFFAKPSMGLNPSALLELKDNKLFKKNM